MTRVDCINKKGIFYKDYSTGLNKLVYVFCEFDWPALSSTRWWRVTVTSGRPAGVGPTRSAVPSIRASSPRRRTGTSKPASSQHYRYICVHNLWWLESVFFQYCCCLNYFMFAHIYVRAGVSDQFIQRVSVGAMPGCTKTPGKSGWGVQGCS